jgi:hypothetical protein
MMYQKLTLCAVLIAVGETFMPCIALLPLHGQSMTILNLPHSCWRKSHEDKAVRGSSVISRVSGDYGAVSGAASM